MPSKKNSNPNVDSGWSWVIFAAGFVDFFLCGVLYCAGIFNVRFLAIYEESKGTTAWSGALQLGLFSLAAPVGSLSNNLFGPRITIFIGSSLVCVGFSLTYFATSYIHVIVTYGILAGLGFCLCYYTSLVMIGFYFDRYRNLAYGFSLTGIGVGIMVFPGLLDYLFEHYDLKGTMLIMGGIQAHMFIVGALTRPVDTKRTSLQIKHSESSNIQDNNKNDNTLVAEKSNKALSRLKLDPDRKNLYGSTGLIFWKNDAAIITISTSNRSLNVKPQSVTTSTYSLPTAANSLNNNKTTTLISTSYLKVDSDDFSTEGEDGGCINKYAELFSVSFMLYLICLFFQGVALYSMYIHFPAYAYSLGVSPSFNSLLMALMGAGSLGCRIIVGIFTNGSKTRTMVAFTSCSFITGIVCLIGPYICTGYIGQIAFALLFSFFANVYIALMSPVVIDLMGLENSILTTGIALFSIGIGVIGGPPFIGLLVDLTGTYYYTFPSLGFCYFMGGLCMSLIPVCRKFSHNRAKTGSLQCNGTV